MIRNGLVKFGSVLFVKLKSSITSKLPEMPDPTSCPFLLRCSHKERNMELMREVTQLRSQIEAQSEVDMWFLEVYSTCNMLYSISQKMLRGSNFIAWKSIAISWIQVCSLLIGRPGQPAGFPILGLEWGFRLLRTHLQRSHHPIPKYATPQKLTVEPQEILKYLFYWMNTNSQVTVPCSNFHVKNFLFFLEGGGDIFNSLIFWLVNSFVPKKTCRFVPQKTPVLFQFFSL